MIQITWDEGRAVAQRQALYNAIADGLASVAIRREDVLVNLTDVAKENGSFETVRRGRAPP